MRGVGAYCRAVSMVITQEKDGYISYSVERRARLVGTERSVNWLSCGVNRERAHVKATLSFGKSGKQSWLERGASATKDLSRSTPHIVILTLTHTALEYPPPPGTTRL
jgi:hypothetical protein